MSRRVRSGPGGGVQRTSSISLQLSLHAFELERCSPGGVNQRLIGPQGFYRRVFTVPVEEILHSYEESSVQLATKSFCLPGTAVRGLCRCAAGEFGFFKMDMVFALVAKPVNFAKRVAGIDIG